MIKQDKITELLKDKETLHKLLLIGHMQNKVWFMHRQIGKLEFRIGDISRELQKKHNLTTEEYIGLAIMADGVLEYKVGQRCKKRKRNMNMSPVRNAEKK